MSTSRPSAALAAARTVLTGEQAVARGMSWKQLWEAVRAGRIRARDEFGRQVPPPRDLSFRDFMVGNGYERPDASWSSDDVAAWLADER